MVSQVVEPERRAITAKPSVAHVLAKCDHLNLTRASAFKLTGAVVMKPVELEPHEEPICANAAPVPEVVHWEVPPVKKKQEGGQLVKSSEKGMDCVTQGVQILMGPLQKE